jgi:hypothetical protein
VAVALEAIDKHFVRWCNASLLPAALLSEVPLAKVVAHVVMKTDYAPNEFEFQSTVHLRSFNIPSFYAFVRSKVSGNELYNPMAATCATYVCEGIDFCNMEEPNYPQYRNFLYHTYLPLASQKLSSSKPVSKKRRMFHRRIDRSHFEAPMQLLALLEFTRLVTSAL